MWRIEPGVGRIAERMNRADAAPPRRVGVIDVGTNSVLLLVAERGGAGDRDPLRVVSQGGRITRLGEGLAETGQLAPAAVERTVAACGEMLRRAGDAGADRVLVVGTEASRVASNRDELRAAVESLGRPFRVISPGEEARLSYLGMRTGLEVDGPVLLVDVGGGSSELVLGDGERVVSAHSMPVGCVRGAEHPGAGDDPLLAPGVQRIARNGALAVISGRDPAAVAPVAVATGGTATTFAAVSAGLERYSTSKVHGVVVERSSMEEWARAYRSMPLEERRTRFPVTVGRESTLVTGLGVLTAILSEVGATRARVSTRALRHGLAAVELGLAGA